MRKKGFSQISIILLMVVSLVLFSACAPTSTSEGGGGGGGDGSPPSSNSSTIGSGGGTYTSPDNFKVVVPASALSSDVTLTISPLETDELPAVRPRGKDLLVCATFGPSGTQFSSDVTLTLPLEVTLTAGDVYDLYIFDTNSYSWSDSGVNGTVDAGGQTISASVDHFSTYGFFATSVAGNLTPPVDALDVPIDTDIYFELDDLGSGINLSTLSVSFEGTLAIAQGVLQTSGSINSDGGGGYDVTIIPGSEFTHGQVVNVLIAVSDSNYNSIPTMDYSFICTSGWDTTSDMNQGRYGHTATLLSDGKVLVIGQLGNCEVYNPETNAWDTTNNLNQDQIANTATLLNNDQVLVAGGTGDPASCELYDPDTGAWSATGSLNQGRDSHTATLLSNGKVLVVGGYGGGPDELTSCELYDPASGTWSATGSLNNGRAKHAAVLLSDGRILVAGGADDATSCELYNPDTGSWSVTGSMNNGRVPWPVAVRLQNNTVLITGGADDSTSCEIYDPGSGNWSSTGSFNQERTGYTMTLLSDNRVMVAGGAFMGFLSSCEIYNPSVGTWSLTASLNQARIDHTATFLENGKILVAGGDSLSGTLTGSELFQTYPPPIDSAVKIEFPSEMEDALDNLRVSHGSDDIIQSALSSLDDFYDYEELQDSPISSRVPVYPRASKMFTELQDNILVTIFSWESADSWHRRVFFDGFDDDHTYTSYRVQESTQAKDCRSSTFTTYQNPDWDIKYPNEDYRPPGKLFEWDLQVTNEGRIYTPWGSANLNTYLYTSKRYAWVIVDQHDQGDPIYDYAVTFKSELIRVPSDHSFANHYHWSYSKRLLLLRWQCYWFPSGHGGWIKYDEDGGIEDTGSW